GPAAEPVEGDEFGEGPGRDLGLAVLSGAVIGMVVVIAGLLGPAALLLVCAVALVLGAAELYGALQQKGYHPATLLGLVGTASLVGAAYWKGEQAFPLVVALLVVFSLLWYLLGV